MFSVDFAKLIKNLLPWFFRLSAKINAWLNALIAPIISLHSKLLSFRESTLFTASVTGQVVSLEFMLNKTFYQDGTLRHIYISDASRLLPFYVYQTEENKMSRLHNVGENFPPVYLFNVNESTGFDFTVWVPSDLVFDYDYMYSLVEKHKAAGFQFEIKTY